MKTTDLKIVKMEEKEKFVVRYYNSAFMEWRQEYCTKEELERLRKMSFVHLLEVVK